MNRKSKQPPIEINGRKFDFDCPHQKRCEKKRVEFSKIAVVVIMIFSMVCIAANYVLAFMNAVNINSKVTIMLISTILGTVVTYFVKSFGEKNSRNKHLKKDIEDDKG